MVSYSSRLLCWSQSRTSDAALEMSEKAGVGTAGLTRLLMSWPRALASCLMVEEKDIVIVVD